VVIPAQASEPDLREALVAAADVRDVAKEKGTPIPYRLLLTKMSPLRTRVTDFIYQELARHGLPIFRTVMVERVAYKEMFLTGAPLATTDTGGAGGEIAALAQEMEAIVNQAHGQATVQTVVG
jgi:chromosome partitioning protein